MAETEITGQEDNQGQFSDSTKQMAVELAAANGMSEAELNLLLDDLAAYLVDNAVKRAKVLGMTETDFDPSLTFLGNLEKFEREHPKGTPVPAIDW